MRQKQIVHTERGKTSPSKSNTLLNWLPWPCGRGDEHLAGGSSWPRTNALQWSSWVGREGCSGHPWGHPAGTQPAPPGVWDSTKSGSVSKKHLLIFPSRDRGKPSDIWDASVNFLSMCVFLTRQWVIAGCRVAMIITGWAKRVTSPWHLWGGPSGQEVKRKTRTSNLISNNLRKVWSKGTGKSIVCLMSSKPSKGARFVKAQVMSTKKVSWELPSSICQWGSEGVPVLLGSDRVQNQKKNCFSIQWLNVEPGAPGRPEARNITLKNGLSVLYNCWYQVVPGVISKTELEKGAYP